MESKGKFNERGELGSDSVELELVVLPVGRGDGRFKGVDPEVRR